MAIVVTSDGLEDGTTTITGTLSVTDEASVLIGTAGSDQTLAFFNGTGVFAQAARSNTIDGSALTGTFNGDYQFHVSFGDSLTDDMTIHGSSTLGNYIVSGRGDDTINGGSRRDVIAGFDGHDVINGFDGHDQLYGGAGNDTISGGSGNDTIYGGSGNNIIDGGDGNDRIVVDVDDHTEVLGNFDGGDGHDTIDLRGSNALNVFDMDHDDCDFTSIERIEFAADGPGIDKTLRILTEEISATEISLTAVIDGNDNLGSTETIVILMEANSGLDISGWTFQDWGDQGETIYIFGDFSSENISASSEIDHIYASGGADTIAGNGGNDVIHGGDGNDAIDGGAGNDVLHGEGGIDTIDAGAGNDTIMFTGADSWDAVDGGAGSDTLNAVGITSSGTFNFLAGTMTQGGIVSSVGSIEIFIGGGATNDIIYSSGDYAYYGAGGDDTMYAGITAFSEILNGGAGVDTLDVTSFASGFYEVNMNTGVTNYASESFLNFENLISGETDDLITGTAGRNIIVTNGGTDEVNAGGGNDSVFGFAGVDSLFGGDGDDYLNGGADGDALFGDAGADTLHGEAGIDTIYGGSGGDTAYGGSGGDAIYGGDGHDSVYGGAGDDALYGENGDDIIYGGADNDVVFGGAGSDMMHGDDGTDALYAGNDDDNLFGGDGADTLVGMNGSDTLNGEAGNDGLTGGAGSDQFVFNANGDNDFVTDFVSGTDTLYFDFNFWIGIADADDFISTYASVAGSDVLFDFGSGDTLLLAGVNSTVGLNADLDLYY